MTTTTTTSALIGKGMYGEVREISPEWVAKRQRKRTSWCTAQFENELSVYRALSALQGTVLPTLHGDSTSEEIILSRVQGRPLYEVATTATSYTFAIALGWAIEAVEALHQAGYVHCDFHAGNVMITEGRAVIIDLGLTEALEGEPHTAWEQRKQADYSRLLESIQRVGSSEICAIAEKLLV